MMNKHLDSYFEWLGRQHYAYKKEYRRLENMMDDINLSPGSMQGGFGITSEAKYSKHKIYDAQKLLEERWGWLSDVSRQARLLLTKRFNNPPALFLNNIHLPGCNRAINYINCGTAGYDGKPLPQQFYKTPSEIYSWFIHDIQRSEGVDYQYFYIRWMEPKI